ncbi:MAG: bifunctional UDP-N-acetylmuramoyl-tripeptide:D-alanyl-D-alanine ligase/alanine racemase [Bacteroidales bacterium]|nr:bifunctional UDP-N-acetylmuramoyl-tripeptide:D-alanyl-D-alanine ligase/alanine racemase [Bacteroidales bacterium]
MKSDWTLNEIGAEINGTIVGRGDTKISSLATDSRTVASCRETLFIALVGGQHDGHNYIGELYERGIRTFLVSSTPDCKEYPEAGFCLVENTLDGLQAMASARRLQFAGEVVAITGSNGKTIVKEWIHQCVGDSIRTHRSPKSYNSQVGVPLSVWGIGPGHELAVIEAGISQPGEMEKLQAIIKPDTGIFTNMGTAHQEHFLSLDEKTREKAKLFSGCKKVICRSDSFVNGTPLVNYLEDPESEIVDWSLEGEARYSFMITGRNHTQTLIETTIGGQTLKFTVPFGDDASIENALHVFVFSIEKGLPAELVTERIGALEPVSMRLEMLQGVLGSILINDTYNSDTGGLAAALDLMGQQDTKKGRMVILSDLLQSGMEERDLYSEISTLLSSKNVDQFVGIGPALCRQGALFPGSALLYDNTLEFLKGMDRTLLRDRIVLIKGSRKFGFERITQELQLKTHQTRLETDLNALVDNLNYFRSLMNPGVETMVMVKALSYGIGNIEIAKLMQFHKVDYLAVAFIDEGVELRKAGIHLPIMVLNPDPSGFASMLDHRLEPEIYNLRGITALHQILHLRGISYFPIHVKLDTGMHRLGFGKEELEQALSWFQKPEFHVASVFTHLAATDDPAHDGFTREQVNRFDQLSSFLCGVLKDPVKRHVLNSAGIERFSDLQYDMVRLGIGLHGIGVSPVLRPVSSFLTTVSQVRTVSAGDSVGYSRRGMTERTSRIATIPVGYADGFHRKLGNGGGKVFVKGVKVPTIGEICMDMTMIDVTGTDVSEGDTVEIFGKEQPVSELADRAGTIPYDILTSIPERVKRVYLQE